MNKHEKKHQKHNPFQSHGNKPQWPGHNPNQDPKQNPSHNPGQNPHKPQWPGQKDKR